MNSNSRIQIAKTGYVIISFAFCVLGVLLIVSPDISTLLLYRIGGVIMLLFGAVKIVGYFSKDLYRLAFQYDLAFGILLMALGVVLVFRTSHMVTLLGIVIGIYVLADALLKIQIAIDSRSFGLRKWWLILSVAVLTGIAGFLLILRPSESMNALMILFGLSLIAEGVLNLITILTAVKIISKRFPEQIE